MAIINCPKCGNSISDKAEKCIHCGCIIASNDEPKLKCSECGNIIESNEEKCKSCGCPIQVTENKIHRKKRRNLILILLSLILIIGCSSFILKNLQEERKKNEARINELDKENNKKLYKAKLKNITIQILSSAADAEECGNKITSIWHNSIFKDDDEETDKYTKDSYGNFNSNFNDSLYSFFSDEKYTTLKSSLEESNTKINKLMLEMKDVPNGYEDAYSYLKNFYDNYIELSTMCLDPSGNYTSYSSSFHEADSKTSNSYNKLKIYIED